MAWNAAGTFHTRLSATALTANRKFVFPDQDGTFVVASAGSVGVDRLSASSVFATVITAGVLNTNTFFATTGSTFNFSVTATSVNFGVELYPGRTIDGATFIDFHATSATDNDFRVIRWGGISGTAELIQAGGGPIRLDASAIAIAGLLSASAIQANVIGTHVLSVSSGVAGAFSITNLSAQNAAVGGNLTVSGTVVAGNVTVAGRISASAGMVVNDFAVGGNFTVSGTTVLANLTVAGAISASAANIVNALVVGGTLTVSGTTVLANLIVAGRISASAGNVVGTFSAGAIDVANGVLTIHRQNAVNEGGEIRLNAAFDDAFQLAIDIIGAGTADNVMRIFNGRSGLVMLQLNLATGDLVISGNLSASGNVVGVNGSFSGVLSASSIVATTGNFAGAVSISSIVAGAASITNLSATTLNVANRISASAGNVPGELSIGTVATSTIFTPGGALFWSCSAATVNCGIELFPGRTVDGATLIDFHATSATDFDLRFVRNPGVGGSFDINNIGGGSIVLSINSLGLFTVASAGVSVSTRLDVSGVLSVSGVATFSDAIILSGTCIVSDLIRLGGAASVAPYDTIGSIVSTAGAAAKFNNTLKAWVSFVGSSAAIRQSFNVSAVSRFGSGTYDVSFINPMSTSAVAMVSTSQTNGNALPQMLTNASATQSMNVYNAAAALTDPLIMNIGWVTGG